MSGERPILPTLPEASGPNPARAKFLSEVAGSLEFAALYHMLDATDQRRILDLVRECAVAAEAERQKRNPR